MQLTNYPQIFTLGHRAIADIFKTPVIVEEKIDGSQFSFRHNPDGGCFAKSKSQSISLDSLENIPKLFLPAVKTFLEIKDKLNPGWTYRGEAVCSPRHNVLKYNRAPKGGFILFDIDDGNQNFCSRKLKELEAERLGLEIVPVLFEGVVANMGEIEGFLERESCLGGAKIEGFVVKNYFLFVEQFKTIMLGKFVSEAFKEKHRANIKVGEPFLTVLALSLRTEARWQKAVQHLQEKGELVNAPEDIGKLMREIHDDVLKEEGEEIKDKLFKRFWKEIASQLTKGFPEWYKKKVMVDCFEKTN